MDTFKKRYHSRILAESVSQCFKFEIVVSDNVFKENV